MSTLEELLEDLDSFPTIPAIAKQVINQLGDSNTGLAEIAGLISQDALLTARIYRLVSSPIYSGQMPMQSLHDAIMRVGVKEIKNLAFSVAILDTLPELPEPLSVHGFWTIGLGTALSAQHLAGDVGYAKPETAYIAGLVHSLGEAYLAINHTQRYARAIENARKAEISYEVGLMDEFGLPHSEVAAEVLRRWNMAEDVVDAVAHHLECQHAEDPLLAGIVFAADRICRDLRLAEPDAGHSERAWVEEIPPELMSKIDSIGYPDITFYLMEQQEFLSYVSDTVRSIFSEQ
ncbi:MAG: HDOD domain-containing protein [Myxococcales bacterium]|nr:HDOD domain-containing protein [Myxococcales bacterium]